MSETKTLNPMAMTADDAARALGVPREWLEEDLAAGAPRNADGTLNLLHYAAWLNLKLGEADDAEA
jgi:hypothetical protein